MRLQYFRFTEHEWFLLQQLDGVRTLDEARSAYGNGAPAPLADEQNDAEKYRQRISRLRQALQLHERNIEALRKEIAAIR